MTTATVEAPTGQAAADRREAQIGALEAAAAAAVTASLAAHLAGITGGLRRGFVRAATDPAGWAAARRAAARQLRAVRPDLAPAIARTLPAAARLGATHAGGHLPTGHDPGDDDLIRDVLDRVDGDVAAKLERAALQVLGRVDTAVQLEDVIGRVDAATTEAEGATGSAVNRAAAGGVRAAAEADGLDAVWWAERGACLSCTSMAGSTAAAGEKFLPVHQFAGRLIPWLADGVDGPPAHRSCRCHLAVATPGLADGLQREAERDVARGQSDYDSLAERLRAVDALLRIPRSRLPKSVRDRAAHDRARGGFSQRQQPSATTSTRRG